MKNFIKTHAQFIKFLFVGGLNTVFGYSVFALLIFIGLYYPFAVVFSTIAGILFNFRTTGKIVFNNSKNSLLIKFIGVYGITCILNIIFLRCFEMINFNMYFAGAILVFPMAVLSFTMNKRFVFKPEEQCKQL